MTKKDKILYLSLGLGVALLAVFMWPKESINQSLHEQLESVKIDNKLSEFTPDTGVIPEESPVKPFALGREDQNKLKVIKEILLSKNDNDPRMDTDLKILSERLKEQLKKEYIECTREDFNARGTLVFLIGRNLRSANDVNFLSDVIYEPLCLSLENCDNPSGRGQGGMSDDELVNQTTLIYPQLTALTMFENYLKKSDYEAGGSAIYMANKKLIEEQLRRIIANRDVHPRLTEKAQEILRNNVKVPN